MNIDQIDFSQRVCVIGAGIVGMTSALKLAELGHEVVIIESGTDEPCRKMQRLNEAIHDCDEAADPCITRTRAIGGTLHQWKIDLGRDGKAGRFIRFQEEDFKCREAEAGMSWPLGLEDLLPYYEEAHQLLGLGEIIQEQKIKDFELLVERYRAGLVSGRFSLVDFREVLSSYLKKISESKKITLIRETTLVHMSVGENDVKKMRFQHSSTGQRIEVECANVIMAAGTIENSRLLSLVETESGARVLGKSQSLGRYYMDHTYGPLLRVKMKAEADASVFHEFDIHRVKGKDAVGFLSIPQEIRQKKDLPNCVLSLIPMNPALASGVSKDVKALLKGDLAKLGRVFTSLPHIVGFIRWKLFGHLAYSAGRIGWAQKEFFPRDWMISGVVEQLPHQDNRIELSDEKDDMGCEKIKFTWKWRESDQEKLDRLREYLVEEFQKIEVFEQVSPDASGNYSGTHHHFGGTRMGRDAGEGVVDRHCKVFGVEGLWVAGTSVFVTSGTANPTLSGMAAALYMVEKNFKNINEAA